MASGHVNRAAPEEMGVIEALVGAAPVQRVLGGVSDIHVFRKVGNKTVFDLR